MPEPRYGKVASGGGMPSGPPRGQQRRDGVVAVAAKRPMEEPVSRPPSSVAMQGDDTMDLQAAREIGLANGTYSPQCCFCGNTERDGLLVQAPNKSTILVCDQCTDKLIDSVRSELPRRRLRLAMERMMAGSVSIETVEAVEKMAGGGGE